MFKNYLTIALRNILRSKTYSAINIAGLAIGIACCLMLALYIEDEYQFDRHHNRLSDLYRIITVFQSDHGIHNQGSCSPPIAMSMRDEVPEIETATRALNPPGVAQNLIKYGDNMFYESNGLLADSTFFDVFTYEFLEGNPKKSLAEANTVVITDQLAQKIFGSGPALNKVINISQGGPTADFKVTGVIRQNDRSHIQANFFTSMTSSGWGAYMRSKEAQGEWGGQNFVPSYVKLVPHHNLEAVIKKMNEVLVKNGSEDMKALGIVKTLSLEPVQDIYLRSEVGHSPRIIYIYVIASIAVFILLIACINFMNLATAKATKRANEIGVRKVMGAVRASLISQILGEAMIIVMIAIFFSVMIVQLALPSFNQLTGKQIGFGSGNVLYFGMALVLITLITGLVAGSYPAFYLSSFQPAQALKGKSTLGNSSGILRQTLVVFQFTIGIALVCGMLIVGKQLHFIENKNLGFDAKSKIVLPLRTLAAQDAYATLQKELEGNAFVKGVAATEYVPGSYIWNDFSLYAQGGNMDAAKIHRVNSVQPGYIELLGIKMIAGRTFNENEGSERNKIIINRTGARDLGFDPQQAVGQELFTEFQGERSAFQVIGVMDDYHQATLKDPINATLFRLSGSDLSGGNRFRYALVHIDGSKFEASIAQIEKTWKRLVNDTPFEYTFLDDDIKKQYESDQQVSGIISSFTFIAMLISCLGLYGLSTYMAERRFKEIGVRKVMGASMNQIVGLMSKEFVKLVLIAFVIAVPLSWYVMTQWLQEFAYRTTIEVSVYVYAGLAALLIALLTVSFESIKAASTNPVESLRNE